MLNRRFDMLNILQVITIKFKVKSRLLDVLPDSYKVVSVLQVMIQFRLMQYSHKTTIAQFKTEIALNSIILH